MRLSVWDTADNSATMNPEPPQLQTQPPATINTATPQKINANVDDLSEVPEKRRRRAGFYIKILLGLLLTMIVLAAGIVPAVVILKLASSNSIPTSNTTNVTCASGLTQTPSGTCVNTQIDFNNCGSVGYVCSSNYTSCSSGLCSTTPAVLLPGALPVPGFNTSAGNIDDAFTTITLPLNITLYNITTNNISVSTNGVVCLGVCSTAFTNGNLPTGSFGGPTVFGFWDDLMIYSGTSQTVYYGISGTAPNRITTFEFYESHFTSSSQYYHFQIIFYENLPNIVTCFYMQTFDGGASATIGVQATSVGPSITYSMNILNAVAYNTSITFDTNAGTVTG